MDVSGVGSAGAFAQSYGLAVAKKVQGESEAKAEANLQLIQSAAAPPKLQPGQTINVMA